MRAQELRTLEALLNTYMLEYCDDGERVDVSSVLDMVSDTLDGGGYD